MVIPLSPQIMFDLYLMCCTWEWEAACKKAGRDDNDTVRPVRRETPLQRFLRLGPVAKDTEPEKSPFSFHRTTLDKVLRVLKGMELITDLQVRSMRNDRDLQNMFYRQCREKHVAASDRHDLEGTLEPLIYLHDMRTPMNKKRLTRDVFYYPTASGQRLGRSIAHQYRGTITKDQYFAELARQADEAPRSPSGKAAIARRYRQRVKEETSSA